MTYSLGINTNLWNTQNFVASYTEEDPASKQLQVYIDLCPQDLAKSLSGDSDVTQMVIVDTKSLGLLKACSPVMVETVRKIDAALADGNIILCRLDKRTVIDSHTHTFRARFTTTKDTRQIAAQNCDRYDYDNLTIGEVQLTWLTEENRRKKNADKEDSEETATTIGNDLSDTIGNDNSEVDETSSTNG